MLNRKIKKGEFIVQVNITPDGILDFKILTVDKAGLKNSRGLVKIISPHLAAIENDLEAAKNLNER